MQIFCVLTIIGHINIGISRNVQNGSLSCTCVLCTEFRNMYNRWNTRFFISKIFISKFTKNQAKTELLVFENYLLSLSTLSSKNNRRYSKKWSKNKYVCLNKAIWFMTMKVRLEMKKRSHRYDMNWPSPRHGLQYTKYLMILEGIKVN